MPQWQLGYRQLRLILKMSRLLHFSVFGESEHNRMEHGGYNPLRCYQLWSESGAS